MYHLYILQCCDGSLYTGVTNDIQNRMFVHNSGKGSKYVYSHRPFKLIYREDFETRSEVQKREFEVKSWSRRRKIKELGLVLNQ